MQVKPRAAARVISDILDNDYQAATTIPWTTVWQVKGNTVRSWISARTRINQPIPDEAVRDILYKGSAYDIRSITQYLRPSKTGINGIGPLMKIELEKVPPKRLDKIWKSVIYTYMGCSEPLVEYLPESFLPLALAIVEKRQSKIPAYDVSYISGLTSTIKAINARFRKELRQRTHQQ